MGKGYSCSGTGLELRRIQRYSFNLSLQMRLNNFCISYPGLRHSSLPGVNQIKPFQGKDIAIK